MKHILFKFREFSQVERKVKLLQLGSDPHVLSERVDYYLNRIPDSIDTLCNKQFLLNVRDLLDKHVTILDENYHLHGQLEKVKARYVYKAAKNIVDSPILRMEHFSKQWPAKCYHGDIMYPFMENGCVIFRSYCKCNCATTVVPQMFLDMAKQEMEGDGLEWF